MKIYRIGNKIISCETLREILKTRPTAPEGFIYKLKEDLTWELQEAPKIENTDPEIDKREAFEMIFEGGIFL